MITMLIFLSGTIFISGTQFESEEACDSAAAAVSATVIDKKFDHVCVETSVLEKLLEDGPEQDDGAIIPREGQDG